MAKRRARSRIASLTAVIVAAAASSFACSSTKSTPAQTSDPVIRLAQSPWDASRIDAAIARILLTTQLGMTVEITEIDEFKQWDAIASGALDASLEVWPSGHAADIARYVDTGQVEEGGALGPIGKIGWYIPSYLLTQHPELSTYAGFRTDEAAALFSTPDSEPLGRFLSGNPTWTQYDSDIIANLALPFKVVFAGTEQAELDELTRAYARREAILLYMWTPHSVLSKLDMTAVQLPPYSDACYAKAATHGIDCDYPPDQLFKILWPGLAAAAPSAYRLLKAFHYTTRDQISLLQQVNNDGRTIEQAAQSWVDGNSAMWKTWLGEPTN